MTTREIDKARRACDIVDAIREYTYGNGFDSGFSFDLTYGDACALVEKVIEPAIPPPEPTEGQADRSYGLGFLAALAAVNKSPEFLESARKNAERMVANGRAMLLQDHARPTVEQLREALAPFAQTGWMTSDTEHTARTIVVHMHPESEREIILSSEDFRRAAAVLAMLAEQQTEAKS